LQKEKRKKEKKEPKKRKKEKRNPKMLECPCLSVAPLLLVTTSTMDIRAESFCGKF
jgi:hypothetical protein